MTGKDVDEAKAEHVIDPKFSVDALPGTVPRVNDRDQPRMDGSRAAGLPQGRNAHFPWMAAEAAKRTGGVTRRRTTDESGQEHGGVLVATPVGSHV
jgi:hypothetical protein